MMGFCSKTVFKYIREQMHVTVYPAWNLCQESIRKGIHGSLLWASSQDYTDMWTRDTFFASWGIDDDIVRPFVDTLRKI